MRMQRESFPDVEKETSHWIDDRRLRRSNFSHPEWTCSGDRLSVDDIPLPDDAIRAPRPVPIPHGEGTSEQREFLFSLELLLLDIL